MRFELDDQYYVSIYFNGEPFFFNPGHAKIEVIQNVLIRLPTLQLTFESEPTGRFLNYFKHGDGTKITLEMGNKSGSGRSIISEWRLYGSPKYIPGPGGYGTVILALLDAIPYIKSRVSKSYSSRSSAVVREIAGLFDFSTTSYKEVDTISRTFDNQVWRPCLKTYDQFVSMMADYAFASEGSCYISAVDEEKRIYYKNISDIIDSSKRPTFVQGELLEDVQGIKYNILQYRIKSSAGTMNNWMGYTYKLGQDKLDGSYSSRDEIELTRHSNFFSLNSEIRESIGIGNSLFKFLPIDCGNMHDNYHMAAYQNKRLKSFYNTVVELTVEQMTDEDLLNAVNLYIIDPVTRSKNMMFDEPFIITAKTRGLYGSRYVEKYQMVSMGQSESDGSQL